MDEMSISGTEKNKIDLEEEIQEEAFEDSGFYKAEDYKTIEKKEGFVDTLDGSVVDKKDLKPFDIIRNVAIQTNTIINEPKEDCRRCYGRGYVGIDSFTKSPIPCLCIYPTKSDNEKMQEAMYDAGKINARPNRFQRRNFKKEMWKKFKNTENVIRRRKERGFFIPPKNSKETSAVYDEKKYQKYLNEVEVDDDRNGKG